MEDQRVLHFMKTSQYPKKNTICLDMQQTSKATLISS
jgi:hypothetical protein